jgi:Mg-chelatase subunit ChlD
VRAAALERLRARFEHLRSRGPTRRRFGRQRPPPSLAELERLDARLQRAGVYTAADLKLLVRLARQEGTLTTLAERFGVLADAAHHELEARLEWVRKTADGRWPAGERARLERAFDQAERIARTADMLHAPAEAEPVELPQLPPAAQARFARPDRPRTAVAAFLLSRGLATVGDLEQRRRDVLAAHALLEGAALEEEVTTLRLRAARDRAWDAVGPGRIRNWAAQSAWLERTAKSAPRTAYAALRVQYVRALEAGQLEAAGRLRAALETFRLQPRVRGMGGPVAPALGAAAPSAEDTLAELLLEMPPDRRHLLDLGRAAARVVAWDDAPAEVDAPEEADPRHIAPDRRLELGLTARPGDARDFLVEDPRRLLHDLAAGAQRVRRLVGGTAPRRTRRTRTRVYLCDASGSMRGVRARFRDALLVAELDDLRRRHLRGVPVDPLELCFFGDRSLQFHRVEDAEEARVWLERLLPGGPCQGMTELSAALRFAAEWLLRERRARPELGSAALTVITDGEDAVDLGAIEAAWTGLRGLPVSFRVVCLGEENRWLKTLIARMRARGLEAGWLHLDDARLAGAPGDFDFRPPTLLPGAEQVTGVELERLRPHLEALGRLARGEEPGPVPVDRERFDALFPEAAEADGADDPWTVDALEAIAEAAALASFETRGPEAVLLLEHLVSGRQIPMAAHLTRHLHPGPRTAEALRRIRLLCRPLG